MTTPQPFLHDDTGAVRFWVDVDGQPVGASIRREVLHQCFAAGRSDDQPLATYQAHSTALHAAVRRRVAGGSIEPVMLREFDLRPTAG
jgi:Protein of unknown function (DUF1488)